MRPGRRADGTHGRLIHERAHNVVHDKLRGAAAAQTSPAARRSRGRHAQWPAPTAVRRARGRRRGWIGAGCCRRQPGWSSGSPTRGYSAARGSQSATVADRAGRRRSARGRVANRRQRRHAVLRDRDDDLRQPGQSSSRAGRRAAAVERTAARARRQTVARRALRRAPGCSRAADDRRSARTASALPCRGARPSRRPAARRRR